MTLHVHTARLGYRGPDWFDVSLQGNMRRAEAGERGGHRGMGILFAPSPDLLYPFLSKRKFGKITPQDWDCYVASYTAEMRHHYVKARWAWDQLLDEDRVVLLCFCADPAQCHRTVLAGILEKLGATNCGELAA